jgi:gamma-glutamylcyclotransferase (GGCT)/AIG2-like uncharacterized protein YtfP
MASDGEAGPTLVERLELVNRRRREGSTFGGPRLEEEIEARFAVSRRLAVYGTLAPGRSNHYLLEDLIGEWSEGQVHGSMEDVGWGAVQGYPALRWHPQGERVVRAHLLVSPELPRHWEQLDAFEGESYVRVLVTFELDGGGIAIANLYEAR